MDEKKISAAVIRRLPRYYRYLGDLKRAGVKRISSGELSRRMQVTASQIRQDLNHFGGFGQQGYGYNVEFLYEEIGKILGLNHLYRVIIIGAGNLGQTLANYANFERIGFKIDAMFDVDPKMIGKSFRGIQVLNMKNLEQYIENNPVDIAALTIPKEAAEETADRLVKAGVPGIWNFAHTDLSVPDGVAVENVHLSESLMRLSYELKHRKQ